MMSRSNSSASSGYVMNTPSTPPHGREIFNIVSLQSTARPGCIIELDAIVDAKQVLIYYFSLMSRYFSEEKMAKKVFLAHFKFTAPTCVLRRTGNTSK